MTGEPGWLVTGSGRCGTGYLATILTECGLNVGHERWWRLDGDDPVPGLAGDVSWLGCFDHSYRGRVLAQVRDPYMAIPSIYAREQTHPYWLLRRCTIPLSGDWPVDAATVWLRYTAHAVERAERWWRVEDITGDLLADVFTIDPGMAAAAVDATPRDVNAGEPVDYPWPVDHPVWREVRHLARYLGYDVSMLP